MRSKVYASLGKNFKLTFVHAPDASECKLYSVQDALKLTYKLPEIHKKFLSSLSLAIKGKEREGMDWGRDWEREGKGGRDGKGRERRRRG
jgi:hypothetical protein